MSVAAPIVVLLINTLANGSGSVVLESITRPESDPVCARLRGDTRTARQNSSKILMNLAGRNLTRKKAMANTVNEVSIVFEVRQLSCVIPLVIGRLEDWLR